VFFYSTEVYQPNFKLPIVAQPSAKSSALSLYLTSFLTSPTVEFALMQIQYHGSNYVLVLDGHLPNGSLTTCIEKVA